MTRILFICLGNICRSPMAEFVMKDLVEKAGIAEKDVADPWFTGNFEDTWRDVLAGCTALLERLCQ